MYNDYHKVPNKCSAAPLAGLQWYLVYYAQLRTLDDKNLNYSYMSGYNIGNVSRDNDLEGCENLIEQLSQ